MWELRLARVEPTSPVWMRWQSTLEQRGITASNPQPTGSASDPPRSSGEVGRSARIAGCLLGGAVGDMLGVPIEFMSLGEIRERFGAAGLREPATERTYLCSG